MSPTSGLQISGPVIHLMVNHFPSFAIEISTDSQEDFNSHHLRQLEVASDLLTSTHHILKLTKVTAIRIFEILDTPININRTLPLKIDRNGFGKRTSPTRYHMARMTLTESNIKIELLKPTIRNCLLRLRQTITWLRTINLLSSEAFLSLLKIE